MKGIPAGYKQTEVGVIPEDWEVKPVDHVCEFVVDCKNRTPPVVDGDEYAVVRTPNVRNGKFVWEELRYTDAHSYGEWTARAIPRIGDILITREAPLGEVCFVPNGLQVCLGQRMMLYRPDCEKVDGRYVLFSLQSSEVRNNLFKKIGGSTVGHAKVDDIRYLQLPLPSTKAEQESIAEVLSDTDALIESLGQLIAKKRYLKQGAMQELLTGKKRLPGFSGKWEVSTLSAVSKEPMQNGIFYSPALKGVGVKLINVGDLYNCAPIDTDSLELFGATVRECERFQVEDGDLFFTRSSIVPSGIAHCNIYLALKHEPVVFDSHVIRMRPDTAKVDPSYLFRFCISPVSRHYLVSHAKTATMTTIDQAVLGKCPVLLPSKAEQTAIATILSAMDAEITALETKLVKTRQLKQGMMHNLLTGRIRLL